jgi:hypothetical protein
MKAYNQLIEIETEELRNVIRWSNGVLNERTYRAAQRSLDFRASRFGLFLEELSILLNLSNEKSTISRFEWEKLHATLKELMPERVDELFSSTLEFEARLHQFGADKGIESNVYEQLLNRVLNVQGN